MVPDKRGKFHLFFAPVVIPTYTRLSKLRLCLESLSFCPGVDKHRIYIYLDGVRTEDDIAPQSGIIDLINSLDGRLDIELIKRSENLGAIENSTLAHLEVVRAHGACIFLEDDIVVEPGFLSFVNGALNHYEKDERITSICGFSIIDASDYLQEDGYFLHRANSWGYGTWNRSFDTLMFNQEFQDRREQFYKLLPTIKKKYGKSFGRLAKELLFRGADYHDVRSTFINCSEEKYVLYPKRSLVKNIGHDGSGEHCGVTTRFDGLPTEKFKTVFRYPTDVKELELIVNMNLRAREPSISKRILDKILVRLR